MSTLEALIMGIVQGATEFLPISSSGHLVLFGHLLGINKPNNTLEVLLHLGTLVAIFIVYYQDILQMIKEFFGMIGDLFTGKFNIRNPYRRLIMLIIVASIPTAIIGLLFQDLFEKLFSSVFVVGLALIITGTFLYISDKIIPGRKTEKNMSFINALTIGTIQGIAITPGISRSGSTIIAGLFCGLERQMAIRFSFLMSIPAVLGALLLETKDIVELGVTSNAPVLPYIIGTLVSTIVGILSIKLLQIIVRKQQFRYFAYYCWIVGLIAIIVTFV